MIMPAWFTRRLWPLVPSALLACGSPQGFEELARESLARIEGEIRLPGLQAEVQVLRDRWGVPHIYAQNLDDLYFAQGFVQAQDRLWQMELWRRIGQGRVAEIVGPEAVRHDRMARLAGYRGPLDDAEFTVYHPDAKRFFTAFTNGINAFIAQAGDNLPVEFKLTGIRPEPWKPEDPLLRVGTANPLSGAAGELALARRVAQIGAAEANRQARPDPWRELRVPQGLDVSIIGEEAGRALQGLQGGFPRPQLLPQYGGLQGAVASLDLGVNENSLGSNNWVVSGRLTASGKVILAGDPHRQVSHPSIRYIVHLVAPGVDAIGATEPAMPGVLIGHNGRIAWGLTIFGIDMADVFVETVNPANRNQVMWQGRWEPLRVVADTINVKGEAPRVVEFKYSRHGPVFYEDTLRHKAYAVKSALHEPGSAGYFAAFRLLEVTNCREFLEALRYYYAPSENVICGDQDGNIAWRGSGLAPRRTGGFDGRLPVPGTGRYGWDGYREDLPTEFNPPRGWIATANNNTLPPGYDPPVFFKRAPYPRVERIREVLSAGRDYTVDAFKRLQFDSYWAEGAKDKGLFSGWTGPTEELERARRMIAEWDAYYRRESAAAALYNVWARRLPERARAAGVARAVRDSLVRAALSEAVDSLRATQGEDWAQWRWGRINRGEFPHPLVSAYDLPAVERNGGAGTVAAVGATYRQITDFANLDGSAATNTPGQSGQPGSPFYDNLREAWANGEYFPLLYTRAAVEANAAHRLTLQPGGR